MADLHDIHEGAADDDDDEQPGAVGAANAEDGPEEVEHSCHTCHKRGIWLKLTDPAACNGQGCDGRVLHKVPPAGIRYLSCR
jgi:cytochrome c5